MKNNISRIERLEEILSSKNRRVLILDEITDEPESWIDVNGVKYIIPLEADVKEFVSEKIKLIKGAPICSLYISKNRIGNENWFGKPISKG